MADRQERARPSTWMQTDLGLTFFWDVRKLWAVDLPVVQIILQSFEASVVPRCEGRKRRSQRLQPGPGRPRIAFPCRCRQRW